MQGAPWGEEHTWASRNSVSWLLADMKPSGIGQLDGEVGWGSWMVRLDGEVGW